MSDFSKLMEAISGDTVDEKIKMFSDVLDKITQFSVNSIDQMTKRVQKVNQTLDALEKRLVQIEQRPRAPAPAAGGTTPPAPIPGGPLGVPPPMTAGAPPPPPEPKPANPMSARSALQGELKNLFAKKKQSG
jgi:hypothetical protein